MTIAALILAAGESTRMGRLKQALPWAREPLVAGRPGNCGAGGTQDVVIVLGHATRDIEGAIPDFAPHRRQRCLQQGRASSLRRGAEALTTTSTPS